MRCPCLSPSFITETVLKKKWITDSPRCMDVINIGIHKLSEMWKNKLMFRELAKIHLSLSRILRLETVMSAISLSSRVSFFLFFFFSVLWCRCRWRVSKNRQRDSIPFKFLRWSLWDTNSMKTRKKLSMPSLVDRSCGVYGVVDGKMWVK